MSLANSIFLADSVFLKKAYFLLIALLFMLFDYNADIQKLSLARSKPFKHCVSDTTIDQTTPLVINMPPKRACCVKRSVPQEYQFCEIVKTKKINPEKCDTVYIKQIHLRYFPECPAKAFCNNYKNSIIKYHIGATINEANAARGM